ncbi:LutC/YkgG family protein [Nocardioides speluncae]|uniref:LutC/YkgG family protein n=1 Tax=Nocardioides speluncae TaxID=2670337 RepID=UPI000D686FC4|nr:lactate utilization protein C [Nocardioides speluncae]
MSAREEILGRVRRALDGVTADPTPVPAPSGARPEDLIGHFVERVTDYRATAIVVAADQVPAAIETALAGRTPIVPAGLAWPVGGISDTGQSAAELDAVEAVVTGAALGIAETGTLVLDHGPGQGRRALSLVPDVHICVVRADQVVADVSDAIALLDPDRPQTWISGPSATSDIELDRVEGVHGPRQLHVIVVVPCPESDNPLL